MKNILIVNTAGLGRGGITTHMLNYIKRMRGDANFDIVQTIYDDEILADEFRQLGCRVVKLPHRKKYILSYIAKLREIVKKNKYEIIHVHGNSSTMAVELSIAKYYGIPIRIAHNHNTICEHPNINRILHKLLKRSYTNAIACSAEAGNWLFGENEFCVLKNAIEVSRYKYNEEIAKEYKRKLNCDDNTLLVAQIGNINEQKNPLFMLNVLKRINNKKIKFIYVGDGPLVKKVHEKITENGLSDVVQLLGIRKDIEKILQSVDVLVLPSLWEGLPLITIEAQAAGTKLLMSKNVSTLAVLNENICCRMELSVDKWVNYMQNIQNDIATKERYTSYECVIKAGYDVVNNVKTLKGIYEI